MAIKSDRRGYYPETGSGRLSTVEGGKVNPQTGVQKHGKGPAPKPDKPGAFEPAAVRARRKTTGPVPPKTQQERARTKPSKRWK